MEFFGHVFHAIIINLIRLPRYAKMTSGKSILVSLGLISFELVILPLAIFFDLWAMRWRDKGLPVMKWDFESMDKIDPFPNTISTDIPSRFSTFKALLNLRKDIIKNIKANKWTKADSLCEDYLKSFDAGPLVIHFVESVHRAIAVTLVCLEKYEWGSEVEKSSFLFQRKCFVISQAVGFEGAYFLDLLAQGMRKKGVMILSADVPHISRLPEGESAF